MREKLTIKSTSGRNDLCHFQLQACWTTWTSKTALWSPGALQVGDFTLRFWNPAIISILYYWGILRDTLWRIILSTVQTSKRSISDLAVTAYSRVLQVMTTPKLVHQQHSSTDMMFDPTYHKINKVCHGSTVDPSHARLEFHTTGRSARSSNLHTNVDMIRQASWGGFPGSWRLVAFLIVEVSSPQRASALISEVKIYCLYASVSFLLCVTS